MNVLDIMTTNPFVISVHKTLRDALELMEHQSVKHLPVISSDKHVIGIVSDRDCRYALNSPFISSEQWQSDVKRINQLSLASIMTPAPIAVEPHVPASEAVRLMLTHRIGCLPVMRSETLVGIVTRSDILIAFMNLEHYYQSLRTSSVD